MSVVACRVDVDDFLKVWKFGQWNPIKVRCEGRIPTQTTWVSGLKIAVLDMKAVEWENYDAEACAKLQGRNCRDARTFPARDLSELTGKL